MEIIIHHEKNYISKIIHIFSITNTKKEWNYILLHWKKYVDDNSSKS